MGKGQIQDVIPAMQVASKPRIVGTRCIETWTLQNKSFISECRMVLCPKTSGRSPTCSQVVLLFKCAALPYPKGY
jgi:hypothetical protein